MGGLLPAELYLFVGAEVSLGSAVLQPRGMRARTFEIARATGGWEISM